MINVVRNLQKNLQSYVFNEDGKKFSVLLWFGDDVEPPQGDEEVNWAFIGAQLDRGAMYQDGLTEAGLVIPSVQHFHGVTGHRTYAAHHLLGQLQDSVLGEPAKRGYNAKTGAIQWHTHYDLDRIQDPAVNVPAAVTYDRHGKDWLSAAHYQASLLHNPASGAPAVQEFRAGALRRAFSYEQGERLAVLSGETLAAHMAALTPNLSP